MVRKTKRELYSGVSIPIDIMDQIEEYRISHPEKKYRSRAEFIIEAIREKLWHGDLNFNEIMSNNEEFKKYLKVNYGMVLDGRGRLLEVNPSYIKNKSHDNDLFAIIDKRLSAIEKKLKK